MAEKKESSPPADGAGKKKKLIIIIGIALLVLVLLIGGGAAWYFLLREQPGTVEDPGAEVPVPKVSEDQTIGPMVDIKEFIVNIISEDERHYVKAALTLELSNEEVLEEVTQRLPQVRDAILLLVGNKTYEELQDLQGKKQLKAELMFKINSILRNGKVKAIYFTDFVVQ